VARQRVVCVGNELCHDDGVAFAVGSALTARVASLASVEIVNIAEFGLSSLEAFLDVEHVIVVDAVTTGNQPGSCSKLASLEFAPSSTCSVGHAVSLSSLLELVSHLQGTERTPRVTVIGIEVENLSPFGTTLSESVSAAVPKAVDLVMTALEA
jgi:hydrogenase maturation protease